MSAAGPDDFRAQLGTQTIGPGTVLLGKYRIVSQIGEGGMGYVLAAEHVDLGTRVAMKFLLPQYVMMRESTERFLREARAASRIPSEHIARVLDAGTMPDGAPYMVMEYLEGQDLSRWLHAGRRFSAGEAIDYVAQAGEALAQAHRVGIVHRDVKPANLFLTHRVDGSPLIKVLDFGISKVMEEAQRDVHLTKTTAVLGSGLYMSPEQMRSPRNVDHRTDVYALGVCLYELLARTQPFTAESFSELCLKVNLEPPDPLRRHRPDIAEDLAAVIGTAYAKSADERYPSIAAFLRALSPYAAPATRATIDMVQRIARESGADLGGATAQPTGERPVVLPVERARAGSAAPGAGKVLGVGAALVAVAAAATFLAVRQPWRHHARDPIPAAADAPSVTASAAAIVPPPDLPAASSSSPTEAATAATAVPTSTAVASASAAAPRVVRPARPPCLDKDPKTGLKNLPCK